MTVTVTKPAFNLREALTSLKRKVGQKGVELLRANTVDDAYAALNPVMFRNKIINGGFDVWQRSVGPVTGADYRTADRWLIPSTGQTSQQVANDRNTSIPYALQVTADSSGYGLLVQRIEDVRTLSGGYATLSFWAKSSIAGSFRFAIFQNFGSGGSSDVTMIDNATFFNMTAANTWQQFIVTVYMPSVAGKTIGAGSFIQVGIGPASGTAGRVFTYSEVQIEAGQVATPFERRPIQQELSLCQRYCQVLGGASVNEVMMTGAGNISGLSSQIYKPCVPFRTTPSLSYSSLSHFEIQAVGVNVYTPTGITLISSISSTQYVYVDINHNSGGTTGAVHFFRAASTTNAKLIFSAEI